MPPRVTTARWMCYTPGMLRAFTPALLACIASALCSPAVAQVRSPWALTARDENLVVSLVTFGVGDDIHQYFGHNALMVEDKEQGAAALYNFGMFSFGPDMLPKYLQGQLEFWAAATPVEPTFRQYMEENRSIEVRELNLSPRKRRFLAERLSYYVEPAHRNYKYDHYKNNCSTKVRDLIDEAIDHQLRVAAGGQGRFTYRGHTRRYTQQDPVVQMLLLLWMNDSMERPIKVWDEAFLPGELERIVDSTQYRDDEGRKVPLVRLAYTVFHARRAPVPEAPSAAWPGLLAVGTMLGALALLLSRWMRRGSRVARVLLGLHHMVIGLCVGVPGLVLFLFLFTKWDVTHYNENLFLANPLTFLAFPLGFWTAVGSRKAQRWLGTVWLLLGTSTVLLLLLKLLPDFDQDTHLPMALLVPINLGCALAHAGLVKRSSHAAPAQAAAGLSGETP
jgi:hypothetical protein